MIPFPAVGIATWDILYAYKGDVAIDLGVVGDKHSDWAGKTFTIELKRYKGHGSDWLVASWVPKGIGGAGQVKSVASQPPLKPPTAPLDAKWLLLPMSIFGLLIATLDRVGDPRRGAAAPRGTPLRAGARLRVELELEPVVDELVERLARTARCVSSSRRAPEARNTCARLVRGHVPVRVVFRLDERRLADEHVGVSRELFERG